jgi:hypothetical protein
VLVFLCFVVPVARPLAPRRVALDFGHAHFPTGRTSHVDEASVKSGLSMIPGLIEAVSAVKVWSTKLEAGRALGAPLRSLDTCMHREQAGAMALHFDLAMSSGAARTAGEHGGGLRP